MKRFQTVAAINKLIKVLHFNPLVNSRFFNSLTIRNQSFGRVNKDGKRRCDFLQNPNEL